jgi:DNA invertase Pin-like site-specific DNA recombinase
MKAIIYSRISTSDKYQNIAQQKDYCKKYAEKEGYEVIHCIGDKISGKIPIHERSGGKRLLQFLSKNPNVHLIVQDIDRLVRNFYDAVEFEKFILKYNITIKSLSEMVDLNSPMGKFTFRIKIAMNAFYVENLHEKIKVGVARAKAEGKYTGRKKGSKNRK